MKGKLPKPACNVNIERVDTIVGRRVEITIEALFHVDAEGNGVGESMTLHATAEQAIQFGQALITCACELRDEIAGEN